MGFRGLIGNMGLNAFRFSNVLKASIAAILAASPIIAIAPNAIAAPGTFNVGANVSYTEDSPAIFPLSDFTLTDASQTYSGGSVTYSIGSQSSGEVLGFQNAETPNISNGVVSVKNGTVFKGNGTIASAIGTIDSSSTGVGKEMKVNFTNSFVNGDFSQGTTGWTVTNSRAYLGYLRNDGSTVAGTNIAGFAPPVDAIWGPGNAESNRDIAGADNVPSHNFTGAKLNMTMGGGNCLIGFGYCVLRGPYVVSNSSVYLANNDSVSFSWNAVASSDAFDVYGYLLNTTDGKAVKLIDETGTQGLSASGVVTATMGTSRVEANYYNPSNQRRSDLRRYTAAGTSTTGTSTYDDRIFTDGSTFTPGNYKFVFMAGSYDDSGGRALGASFTIDDVAVSSSSQATVNANDIQALSRLLTYSDSRGQFSSRTLSFASSNSDSGGASSSKTISVTQVNDAPTLAAINSKTYNDTLAVDTFTNHSANLVGFDEEGATLTYGLPGATVSGTTATLVDAFGTVTLNTASGAFTFAPDNGALNASNATESRAITFSVSDGSQSTTANFVIIINGIPEGANAPGGLSASASDSQIVVSFTAVPSAGLNGGSFVRNEYQVNNTGPWVSVAGTTFTLSGLTNGTLYSVKVRVVTLDGGVEKLGTSASAEATPNVLTVNSVLPTISGTALNGQALAGNVQTWTGVSNVYTYQWQRSDTSNADGAWSDIGSATTINYTLSLSDVSKYIRLKVTATNSVSTATAYSLATNLVRNTQTISNFVNPGTKLFSAGSANVSATSDRGLLISFTSTTPLVCSAGVGALSGNVTTATVTFISSGTCAISSEQAGSTTFGPTTLVGQSFAISTTAPTAPRNASTTVIGITVSVSWSAPSSNGGSPITRYVATATPTTGAASTCNTVPISGNLPLRTCDISGLDTGVTYTVRVIADTTASFTSPNSSPVRFSASVPGSIPTRITRVAPQSFVGTIPTNVQQQLVNAGIVVPPSGVEQFRVSSNLSDSSINTQTTTNLSETITSGSEVILQIVPPADTPVGTVLRGYLQLLDGTFVDLGNITLDTNKINVGTGPAGFTIVPIGNYKFFFYIGDRVVASTVESATITPAFFSSNSFVKPAIMPFAVPGQTGQVEVVYDLTVSPGPNGVPALDNPPAPATPKPTPASSEITAPSETSTKTKKSGAGESTKDFISPLPSAQDSDLSGDETNEASPGLEAIPASPEASNASGPESFTKLLSSTSVPFILAGIAVLLIALLAARRKLTR